jgi:hypothetical protein
LAVEQSYRDYISVDNLDYPWVNGYDLTLGLIDDAILGFDFGSNKSNFENLTIRIFDEKSAQYIAEDALYLLDNPNAVEDLREQYESMDWSDPNHYATYQRLNKLENVQNYVEGYYGSFSRQDWEAELEKGIYVYEYVYGEDDEFFI